MNTLSPDVTQMTDANPTTRPGAAAAADVRQQLSGKHVCPFCGVIRADALQPCPRCTMEDSTATRSATRQRIGPWFVLQARNPSAPGMRYVTLLSLVRKGHVTPRSILRGPTTHQLWTFAASVRGLSREFGLCYHCGEQIDSAAPNCSHCLKSQDLPADPDTLLEPVPEMQVSAQPATLETGMDGGTSLDLQADPYPAEESPLVPAPAVPRPAPPTAASMAASLPAAVPSVVPFSHRPVAPSALATRDAVQRASSKEETILTARELAAAFQLDFKPPNQQTSVRKFGPFKTVAAVLLIGLIGTGIVLFLRPEWREQSIEWVGAKWDGVRAELDKPASPGGTTAIPPKAAAPTPASTDVRIKPKPPGPTPANPTPAPTVVTPPPEVTPPAPAVVEAPPIVVPPPQVVVPPPAVVAPPEPVPEIDVDIPDNITIEQATRLAADLRNRAIDAEVKKDWRGAVFIYQQIQRLPRDAWPSDLQTKLNFARSRAN